jgi:hypothetical protein
MGFSSRLAFDAKESPASLGMSFRELSGMAANKAFEAERTTPEYLEFLEHVERCKRECGDDGDWQDCASSSGALRDAIPVKRLRNVDPNTVGDIFLCDGDGQPVIIEDGGRDWDLSWGDFDVLKNNLASFEPLTVTCNDRAPARMADAKEGLRQRTFSVALDTYLEYVQSRTLDPKRVPFYANGLRVFSEGAGPSHRASVRRVSSTVFHVGVRPHRDDCQNYTRALLKGSIFEHDRVIRVEIPR